MKLFRSSALVVAVVLALGSAGAFGQGSITPPGAPAPTMKTLSQVEPRTIVNAANTPGDASSTFIISTSGSYYLAGNLTAAAGKHGISIRASDVTLDLSGFSLASDGSGTVRGIDVAVAQSGLTIRNGNVRGWSDGGVRAEGATGLFEKLSVTACPSYGLRVGNGSMVRDCVATSNQIGFSSGDRVQFISCIATTNTGNGFDCTSYVAITDCTASRNNGAGIVVQNSCGVTRCTATRSAFAGINAGSGCTITACTAGANMGDGITALSDNTIQNCTASANSGNGITVRSTCQVSGNTCNGNVLGISVTGPDNGGLRNRIDGNSCSLNQTGISIYGLSNVVIRNDLGGNSSQPTSVFPAVLNSVGPISSEGGTISTTSPWANFSH